MNFGIAILDLDPICYRAGFSVEKYNKELETLEVEPLKHALYNVNSMIRFCLKESGTNNYKGFLTSSDKSNFRFSIYPAYKENRKDSRKPYWYKEIREFLVKRWNAEIVSGEEADDACSICQYNYNNLGFDPEVKNSIVWSFDKDFNNIPGWHGNYIKKEIYYISEIEALRNFYLQILTGDTSDGIPRIKKGWKKKETEIRLKQANSEDECRRIVIDVLRDTFQEAEEVEINQMLIDRGRLVWLRREPNQMWSMNAK
jgi:5'-3' exonuclease